MIQRGGAFFAAVLLLATACTSAGDERHERERGKADADHLPNVVVFVADDLDAFATSLETVMPRTTELIGARGLTFTNAFAPDPICCPARATLLTGRFAHNTGVKTNGGPEGGFRTYVANGNEEHSLPVWLEDAGYHTALLGKYLNGLEEDPTHVPPGWTDWYGSPDVGFYRGYDYDLNENGTIVHYGTTPDDYSTDVVAEKTVEVIERAERDDQRPLFLWVASTAPHIPLPAPPRHAADPRLDTPPPAGRPGYDEPDLSDKPAWLQQSAARRSELIAKNLPGDWRNRIGSLLALDDLVAGTVEALDEAGELDDTYLVFVSDNGYNLGSHRLMHKMAPYEESIRVPLMIAGPGVGRGTADATVLHTDLAPTILELAGIAVPADVDGRSLLSLLRGDEPQRWRRSFPVEYASDGLGLEMPPELYYELAIGSGQGDIPAHHGVRTDRWLYVEWLSRAGGTEHVEPELYDLSADPFELDNLLATPDGQTGYATTVEELRALMEELFACRGETCRDADRHTGPA